MLHYSLKKTLPKALLHSFLCVILIQDQLVVVVYLAPKIKQEKSNSTLKHWLTITPSGPGPQRTQLLLFFGFPT